MIFATTNQEDMQKAEELSTNALETAQALELAQLKIAALETLIDVAELELGIDK